MHVHAPEGCVLRPLTWPWVLKASADARTRRPAVPLSFELGASWQHNIHSVVLIPRVSLTFPLMSPNQHHKSKTPAANSFPPDNSESIRKLPRYPPLCNSFIHLASNVRPCIGSTIVGHLVLFQPCMVVIHHSLVVLEKATYGCCSLTPDTAVESVRKPT